MKKVEFNKNEKFRVNSIEELIEAYEYFKDEWDTDHTLEDEIRDFIKKGCRFINKCSGGIFLFDQCDYFNTIPNPLKNKSKTNNMRSFSISGSPALKKAFAEEVGVEMITSTSHLTGNMLRFETLGISTNTPSKPNFNLPEQWHEAVEYASKPEIKVGKWYKTSNGAFDNLIYITGFSDHGASGYGFENGEFETRDDNYFAITNATRATDDEVKEALVEEVKRRGFKEGVKIKSKWLVDISKERLKSGRFVYHSSSGSLSYIMGNNSYTIFRDGHWAEIIEEETYKIGDTFKRNSEIYILCMAESGMATTLVCVNDGNRWGEAYRVKYAGKITQEEFERIAGYKQDEFTKTEIEIREV